MEYAQAHRLSAAMVAFSFLALLAMQLWRPGAKRRG
jgi:molybdate transport system permease protein